jgi:thioester reductase-like protein
LVFFEEPATKSNRARTAYAYSKWVAEHLIQAAQERGLPAVIYRPGNIVGDSNTGVCNPRDFLFRMFKGCLQLRLLPDTQAQFDMTPIDFVSKALIYISQQDDILGKYFHLVNPQSVSFRMITDWMLSLNLGLTLVSMNQWREVVQQRLSQEQDNALYPLLPLLTETLHHEQINRPNQTHSRIIRFDSSNTNRYTIQGSIECPQIDRQLLSRYFHYMLEKGDI